MSIRTPFRSLRERRLVMSGVLLAVLSTGVWPSEGSAETTPRQVAYLKMASRGAPRASAPGQWSMHMSGPRRLGRSRYFGPQTPNEAWRYPIETNFGGAVIGRDGTVYMGALSGQFLALNPDGSVKWSITVPGSIGATPAILLDGRIAFVNAYGTLYVVRPNGFPSWRYATGTACSGCPEPSPAIGSDGTIYFGVWETVYALSPGGGLKWSFHIPGQSNRVAGPVSVGPDGVVYLPTNYLYALNPDGTVKWHSVDEIAAAGSPAIGDDGTIYVHTHFTPRLPGSRAAP